MLAIIGVILIVLWLIGLAFKVTVWAIHLALIVGLVLIVLNFLTGRRPTADARPRLARTTRPEPSRMATGSTMASKVPSQSFFASRTVASSWVKGCRLSASPMRMATGGPWGSPRFVTRPPGRGRGRSPPGRGPPRPSGAIRGRAGSARRRRGRRVRKTIRRHPARPRGCPPAWRRATHAEPWAQSSPDYS